ncbi:response regulator transcription factor [Aquabacter spiritensis]|uniref:Regulatory Fis family protein n=1 Tax=Aquabacter spiritensis TaxID=933073 RepID=A0A4R3M2X1_9HYPH|nr:response regulator [Aquabacter spiritensis]TCT05607.1 regulatory Fis family protein [Aquabacter spiritensis]
MGARILIVEDDPLEAARLEGILSGLGHACTVAEDGDAALRLIAGAAFDCILLDLVLPGLDGMGVLGRLRAAGNPVPVVAAVTPMGLDAVESALNAGARDFVVKPAGRLRLQVSIANAVGARAPARPGSAHDCVRWPGPVLVAERPAEIDPEAGASLPLRDRNGHARPLAHLEKAIVAAAVDLYGGRMSEVARRLGIGRSTLYRRFGAPLPDVLEHEPPLSVAAE